MSSAKSKKKFSEVLTSSIKFEVRTHTTLLTDDELGK